MSVDPSFGFVCEPDEKTIANPNGEIQELVWSREGDNTFKLAYVTALSIGDAVRLNNNILHSCEMILTGVPEIVAMIQRAMAIYTDKSKEGIEDLFVIARWISESIAETQAKMRRESDPQQKAAILLRSICSPQRIADINLKRIVAQVAVRNASIETARQENLRIVDELVTNLKKFLAAEKRRFKKPYRAKKFSALWYNNKVTQIKQISIPSYQLWCTPYTQLGAELHNHLAEVIDFLKRGLQFDAALKIRQIITQLVGWRVCLDEIQTAGSKIKNSPEWPKANFGEISSQLNDLKTLINAMPGILRLVQKLLREDLNNVNKWLEQSKWPEASQELDHLIARCKW